MAVARYPIVGAWAASPLALLFVVPLLAGCDDKPQQPAASAPPPAVTVIEVKRQDVVSALEFVGRVEAVDKVELRARVTGFLEKRLFQEGESVKAGDLLFVIQPDEFKATVDQRKADIARAEAAKENTVAQLRRAEILVQKKDIPEATVDERRAADRTATAEILEAKAALEKAELDLGYTEIRAPIGGRIGRAAFTVGNLIGPDSGVLATIVSQDPIYVNFPISQRILLDVRKQNEGRGERAKDSAVVRLRLADGSQYPHPGKIDFADIQISQSTDTLAVRAVVANPDSVLIDGQFVTVSVEGDKPEPRIVIPQVAVNADQAGLFVLVVDGENKVEVRRIKPGSGREGQLVVEEGLNEGDRIITEGLQKVRPGQVVRPAAASAAQPKA